MSAEQVVLLNDQGHAIGSADKRAVHTTDTPLHLAFSCHLVDDAGRLLLTRRALGKQTWPGVWTNSFCGHPAPGEELEHAVRRRARHELGVEISDLRLVLPDFRYRAVDASGIVEHELCPVFVARAAAPVLPNANEVAEHHWAPIQDVRDAVSSTPFAFSPWLTLQLPALLSAGALAIERTR